MPPPDSTFAPGATVDTLLVAVLAAGGSRRLGRAKQLVPIGGEPLLRRQCRCALAADVGDVIVILGCDARQHNAVIEDLPVDAHVNLEWSEGLAATIRCAVRTAALRHAALLILPCDQYRIVPGDLRALCERWRRSPSIACVSRAARYAGPPAILPRQYHDHMLRLRGDAGARSLLYGSEWPHPAEVINPRAMFDIDSPEDAAIAQRWNERRSA